MTAFEPPRAMGERRFGRVNWQGLATLIRREIRRFLSVWTQTVAAPVATSLLFLIVFSLAFGARREALEDIDYTAFLVPGVLMMAVIQNSFANTVSSIMIAKVQGNIVDTLMPPLSAGEILTGYLSGAIVRGSACAAAIAAVCFPLTGIGVAHIGWALWFVLSASVMLGLFGVLVAIYARRFDQQAAITNFIITPLSFLSGTFYSIDVLPDAFWYVSHINPFFYLIDGFRFATLDVSDSSPWIGFAFTVVLNGGLGWVAWRWLATGYRLKA